jgi:hypothetical protein
MTEKTLIKSEEIELDYDIFDTDEKIEIATQTLERNIDFVKKCDDKASFTLAIVGVILSIVFSDDRIASMMKLLFKELNYLDNFDIDNTLIILYLILTFLVLLLTIIGVIYLISVFYPQIKGSTRKSLIFFRGICDQEDYFQCFKTVRKHELLDDLIDQINVNSQIALKKYKRFNIGFLLSLIGLSIFILLTTLGMFSIG